MALYKTAKGTSHRNTDTETLNKLLREGMLIESEEGMKCLRFMMRFLHEWRNKWRNVAKRMAKRMAKRGEMNDETDGDIKNNAGKENSSTTESHSRNDLRK